MKYTVDRFSLHLFLASAALLIFGYGWAVGAFRVFPYRVIVDAAQGCVELCTRYKIGEIGKALPWYFTRVKSPYPPAVRNTGQAYQGLNLVSRIAAGRVLSVMIMDMDGRKLHEWIIDWFKIWPDAKHVPDRLLPMSPPGTRVNPAILMENGDLVFTFAQLGLVRMNRQGEIVWRLPYQTHHSIERDDNGNLWVCGQKEHSKPSARFPNQIPPFIEDTILEVTPEGKIVWERSVPELLRKNGLTGLLYLGNLARMPVQGFGAVLDPSPFGDALHLNDVEPFPTRLKEGFFKKGDLLVSLHAINAVLAFNRETEKIKFIRTGWFIGQHDPDFIDGNTFSVFDNNATGERDPQSRIAIVSAPDKTVRTFFEGTAKHPFYSKIMGRHQWLPNGNLLISETCQGRAFEVDPQGKIVWEYLNYVDDGVLGIVEDVERLPAGYSRLFTAPGSDAPKPHRPDPRPAASSPMNANGS